MKIAEEEEYTCQKCRRHETVQGEQQEEEMGFHMLGRANKNKMGRITRISKSGKEEQQEQQQEQKNGKPL
ncbi:hypothetical protein RUM44_008037 [Polyplax serrata]|uniref:Uncharacterized protein n=1 Tax=Polyplax serrata TaxID=468196 RepID=A0ABR1BBL4_POLSC